MLCQFSFKNFKSYKETTTFDFQATSIPEFSESLLKSEKADALLPVGVYIWSEWWRENQSVTSSFMFDFYSG